MIQYRILNNKVTAELYVWVKEPWQTYSISIESDTRRSQPYPYDDEQWILSQNGLGNNYRTEPLESTPGLDNTIVPRIAGHQFTDEYIKRMDKFDAYIIYDEDHVFSVESSEWSRKPMGGTITWDYTATITNNSITAADDIDLYIYENSFAELTEAGFSLSGTTGDGYISLWLTKTESYTSGTPGSIKGVYKIRKPALAL